jgi:hypothetical protein
MPAAVPTREQAHSGEWSAKIDAQHPNVMLGGTTWQALGQPRHLRVNLWVWLYRPQPAAVVQVSMQHPSPAPGTPGDRMAHQILYTGEAIRRYQRWEHTTLFVTVPGEMQPTDEVTVSIWGQGISGKDLFYFDDLTIENAD